MPNFMAVGSDRLWLPEPLRWSRPSSTWVRSGRNDTSATPMSDLFRGGIPEDFAFFEGFDLPELLRATAWPTSTLKADSSTSSPSGMSIARRAFPSRLELKRRAGSFRDAPVVRPNRSAHPLPVLDHVWVCFLDELA